MLLSVLWQEAQLLGSLLSQQSCDRELPCHYRGRDTIILGRGPALNLYRQLINGEMDGSIILLWDLKLSFEAKIKLKKKANR